MTTKIIARSSQEFKEIFDKLNTLPEQIFNQIETAENMPIGLKCRLAFSNELMIMYIPDTTTEIINYDSHTAIHTDDNIFFIIDIKLVSQIKGYVFVTKHNL